MKPPAWLPVVDRELRAAARRPATWRWRTAAAANLPTRMSRARSPVRKSSGSVPSRRSALSASPAAASLNVLYALLGLLPLLAVPLLLGGLPAADVALAALALLNLLFGTLAVSLLASCFTLGERQAVSTAVLAAAGWAVGVPLGALALAELLGGVWRQPVALLALTSPLAALAGGTLPGLAGGPRDLAFTLALSHALGWGCLAAAAVRLRRDVTGRERNAGTVRAPLEHRLFTPADRAGREAFRRGLLDLHPMVWLAERHPGAARYGAIFVGAVILILASGAAKYGASAFSGLAFLPIVLAIHLTLLAWSTSLGCQRAVEDRRSGALELWLSTPLTDADLLRGHWLLLRRLFLAPVTWLVAGEIVLAWLFFDERRLQRTLIAAALILPLDMAAASALALRFGLTAKNVNQAAARVFLLVPAAGLLAGAALQLLANGLHELLLADPQPRGRSAAAARPGAFAPPWIWIAGTALFDLGVLAWVRRDLHGRLRELAVAAHGPRA